MLSEASALKPSWRCKRFIIFLGTYAPPSHSSEWALDAQWWMFPEMLSALFPLVLSSATLLLLCFLHHPHFMLQIRMSAENHILNQAKSDIYFNVALYICHKLCSCVNNAKLMDTFASRTICLFILPLYYIYYFLKAGVTIILLNKWTFYKLYHQPIKYSLFYIVIHCYRLN